MSNKITKEDIISFILKCRDEEVPLNVVSVRNSSNSAIYYKACRVFGSWKKAIESAGLDYFKITTRKKWTKALIVERLKNIEEEELADNILKNKHSDLYAALIKIFGSRKEALLAAGLNYEATLPKVPWTKDRVISTIQMFHLGEIPLNFKYVNTYHTRLRKNADKFFGSWGEAIGVAGLNYDEIKKNKGWAKPFLAEDGQLYISQIEGLVANELLKLKDGGGILGYKTQQVLTPGRNWTCDFVIKLNNNANLWLEVDGLGDNRNKKHQFEEKLRFYEKAGFLYHKATSPNNISNIIERYANWFSIPLKDTIITSHINPDGDALSSARAAYNYLLSNGKKAVLRFAGDIPKNLLWIIEDVEITKRVPEWAESLLILDCAPTNERVGWDLPELPIYNIDHHIARIDENDPDNGIHVIKACSTASILFNKFGIVDDILAVGVYTDTLFTKNIREVMRFLYVLDIDEEKLGGYVSRINSNPDKKLWDMLKESSVHKCRNGFIIVEHKEDSPDVIESFIQILSKLSESVCLIYGEDKKVKLRTSNPNMDLSIIAKEYSGGGHPYAAMCNISGKRFEFKNKIIAMNVPKINTYRRLRGAAKREAR